MTHKFAPPLLLLVLAWPTHAIANPATTLPQSPTRTDDGERSNRLTSVTATLVLKVTHPDQVRKQALELAKAVGGFPTFVTDAQLDLKVPPAAVEGLLGQLAQTGLVMARTLQRSDRTETIADLQARLKTKREVFQRLRTFLDDSNVAATLKVERSMSQLVSDLEMLRGQLDLEETGVRHATVRLGFQFRQEKRVDDVRSPFDWINTVDLDRFLAEF